MKYVKMFSMEDGYKTMVDEINEYIQSKPLVQVLGVTNVDENHILIIFDNPVADLR